MFSHHIIVTKHTALCWRGAYSSTHTFINILEMHWHVACLLLPGIETEM